MLLVSAGEVASRRLLEECAALALASPLLRGSVLDENKSELTLSNGSRILSVPASQRQIRGWPVDLLVIDEAGFIDHMIWRAAEPAVIARPGSRVILTSSPWGGPDHFYRQLWARGMSSPDAQVESFHWPSTVSPLVDAGLLEQIREREPADYFAREYLAEWTDEAGSYFTEAELSAAATVTEMVGPEDGHLLGGVIGGVDWGFARDANALAVLGVRPEPDERGRSRLWVPYVAERFAMAYDDWIDELLAHLGLADKANANMRQLSGGMKRRVLVAQALVHKPPIIVLDEPTAGVDVELRQTLWHFIARLNKEGHTVLLTTHYLEEAEALCGRIAMLKAGQVVALNRTSELLKAASGSVLQFKTDAVLPAALASIARVTGRIVQLPAQDAAEIENHLATLRVAGVDVQDMEIRRPDLEDVFLQVMSGTSASNIPLSEVAL